MTYNVFGGTLNPAQSINLCDISATSDSIVFYVAVLKLSSGIFYLSVRPASYLENYLSEIGA